MEKISPIEIKRLKILTESKETDAIINCIEKLGLDIEKIGEGGNAEVFAVVGESEFSELCLKRIKEAPQFKDQNIDREHKFQMMAKKAGVTTPLTLVSFESEKGAHLIMEKINGYSVRDIAKNNDLLPDDFDLQKFKFHLKEELDKLHSAGIVHRDLNAGNVLVTQEGKPVIIDYGSACEGNFSSEWIYEETVSVKNESGKYEIKTGAFIDDNNASEKLISSLRESWIEKIKYLQLTNKSI